MRYLVVVALFILSMITYIDRVCISTAKEPISRDLALSDTAMGMVFGMFALGYALALRRGDLVHGNTANEFNVS